MVYLQRCLVVTWMVPRETSAAVSARSVYTTHPRTSLRDSCMHDDDEGLMPSDVALALIFGTKMCVLTTKDYDHCPDFKRLWLRYKNAEIKVVVLGDSAKLVC